MATRYYNSFRNGLLNLSNSIDFDDAGTTIRAALFDEGAVAFNATHQFLSDVSAGVVGSAQTIGSKTVGVVGVGVFDGADVTFTAVSGASCESLLPYKDTGSAATSPLIGLFDQVASGLPTTPNGGNITVAWPAAGILGLS